MKKIIFIALFIIFVVGCSKKEAPKPTLLEIMSSSCSMCKEMKPIIAKVQEKYEGMISFLIYDTDTTAGAEQANLYAIKKIPTLLDLGRLFLWFIFFLFRPRRTRFKRFFLRTYLITFPGYCQANLLLY